MDREALSKVIFAALADALSGTADVPKCDSAAGVQVEISGFSMTLSLDHVTVNYSKEG